MNLLPLEIWRIELGYNPWHFWGCHDPDRYPVTSKCNDVVKEYAWQDTDAIGRTEIRSAIEAAENILLQHLFYAPAPRFTSVTVPFPKYFNPRLSRTARHTHDHSWIPVVMPEGYIVDIGVELLTPIQLNEAIVWTDEDVDGIPDTGNINVPTTLIDPTQIAVYVSAANRLSEEPGLSDRWRIQPISVTISGGLAMIKFKRWLAVRPILYEAPGSYPILSTTDANFLPTVDVYSRTVNKNGLNAAVDSQSALIWESHPCKWCGCSTPGSTDPASEGWVAGRVGIRSVNNGIVLPAEAVYNAATGTWSHPCECYDTCGEPEKVLIRYLGGYPLDSNGNMDKVMRTLVARLACAEMPRRICACDIANREWSNWAFDVSRIDGPETYQANLDLFNNPLGTRRGHMYAWSRIKSLARAVGTIA